MLCTLALVTIVALGGSCANAPAEPEHAAAIQVSLARSLGGVDARVEDRSSWMRLAQERVNPDNQAGPRSQSQPIPGRGIPSSLATPRSISQSEDARNNDVSSRTRVDTLALPPGR
jgi:hypothetical protein